MADSPVQAVTGLSLLFNRLPVFAGPQIAAFLGLFHEESQVIHMLA
jgi:hypothetical protein